MSAIYSIDARDNMLPKISYDYFNMSAEELKKDIKSLHSQLVQTLIPTGINYSDFRSVLEPSKGKDSFEQLFVFRLGEFGNEVYQDIHKNIIPLLDKECRLNILMGDLIHIDFSFMGQYKVISLLYDVIGLKLDEHWQSDYYLVYFNNISRKNIDSINNFFEKKDYYLGTADMTFDSFFKSYISIASVGTRYIKIGANIFNADPDIELAKVSNINMGMLEWEENNYKVLGINDILFNTFLKYKIDTSFGNISSEDDMSIHSIIMSIDEQEKLPINEINIDPPKYTYLENVKNIFERIGVEQELFLSEINKKIKNQSFYNIKFLEEHNVVTFNVFLEFDNNRHTKKYTLALTYKLETKEILVGTMY